MLKRHQSRRDWSRNNEIQINDYFDALRSHQLKAISTSKQQVFCHLRRQTSIRLFPRFSSTTKVIFKLFIHQLRLIPFLAHSQSSLRLDHVVDISILTSPFWLLHSSPFRLISTPFDSFADIILLDFISLKVSLLSFIARLWQDCKTLFFFTYVILYSFSLCFLFVNHSQ